RDVFDLLNMAAGLALHPEFLPRAAPEMGLAGLNRAFQRGAVHPRHHQHPPRLLLLHNRRDETIGIKLQFVVKAHNPRFIAASTYPISAPRPLKTAKAGAGVWEPKHPCRRVRTGQTAPPRMPGLPDACPALSSPAPTRSWIGP